MRISEGRVAIRVDALVYKGIWSIHISNIKRLITCRANTYRMAILNVILPILLGMLKKLKCGGFKKGTHVTVAQKLLF